MGRSEKSLSQDGNDEKGQPVVEVANEPQWTPEFEKKLVRKIDLYLMPIIWIMNVLSWMDRAKFVSSVSSGLPLGASADMQLNKIAWVMPTLRVSLPI